MTGDPGHPHSPSPSRFPRGPVLGGKWLPCLISMIYKRIFIEMSLIIKTIHSFFFYVIFLILVK